MLKLDTLMLSYVFTTGGDTLANYCFSDCRRRWGFVSGSSLQVVLMLGTISLNFA